MAKFLTITQRGFYFTVHDADKNIADETWTIKRVGAFMAVHHTLNVMATKYAKGLTFRTSVASIMYTLRCDGASSHDLNKITKWLVPQLCDMYEDTSRQGLLGRQLSEILDDVTQMVEQHIAETEAPMTVFGKVVKPEPFFTRPTELEYNAAIEAQEAEIQGFWDRFNKCLENRSTAVGHRISIREGSNVYTGVIVDVSPKCIYCDVKDEYNRLIQHNARFPKNSKRFIIESFK